VVETFAGALLNRIEISGWDMDATFFVEKADVGWQHGMEKRVKLRRWLRKGSVIFVRPMNSSAQGRMYPRAYEVEPMAEDEQACCEYRLTEVRSRGKSVSRTIH